MRDRLEVRCEAGDKYGIILLDKKIALTGERQSGPRKASKGCSGASPSRASYKEASLLLLGKTLNRDMGSDVRDQQLLRRDRSS